MASSTVTGNSPPKFVVVNTGVFRYRMRITGADLYSGYINK